jgi:hypothetical protein
VTEPFDLEGFRAELSNIPKGDIKGLRRLFEDAINDLACAVADVQKQLDELPDCFVQKKDVVGLEEMEKEGS